MSRRKIQVLVVDDSPVDRELLIEIIGAEPDFEVAGQAADAYEARDKIRSLDPDVVTLDVSMPGMDGIKFLRNLMRLRPMPVVMVSVTTDEGAAVTLDALQIGAVDFVTKPGATGRSFAEYRREVASKVRMAAYARVTPCAGPAAGAAASQPRRLAEVLPFPGRGTAVAPPEGGAPAPGTVAAPVPAAPSSSPGRVRRERAAPVDLIAIGASTGGVGAIEAVLGQLPVDGLPPVVVTQHIPAGFSQSFAQRLDSQLELEVRHAVDGMPIVAGHVYIAPGGHQFAVERAGDGYVCRVTREPRVNLHRPSVQVLFHSVAKHAGARAIGVLLTGMGADGAQGLLEMRRAGAYNVVQDEATSVVWGMPGAAARLGAADEMLPLGEIARAIGELVVAGRDRPRRRVGRRRSARSDEPLE
ncbi:MAG: chemotaxis response regulator protein-glutamate methylesterase [Steroidobacteraceae bacterium]|jgi:two-component system chemotaxis response regulator CheB|nr:chemotaxis response regulator protein-glutamate methylesterase [Steroidobacteraceae bacterium]